MQSRWSTAIRASQLGDEPRAAADRALAKKRRGGGCTMRDTESDGDRMRSGYMNCKEG